MILAVSLNWFLHGDNSLRHEGIQKKISAASAGSACLTPYTMCLTQTKTQQIACGAFLHTIYNENGLWRFYSQHLSYTTYQKTGLLVVLLRMWERGWNYTRTSNLMFTIGPGESIFITIEDWGLSTVVSTENEGTGQINDGPTLDQQWINGGSTMDQWSINDNMKKITYITIILSIAEWFLRVSRARWVILISWAHVTYRCLLYQSEEHSYVSHGLDESWQCHELMSPTGACTIAKPSDMICSYVSHKLNESSKYHEFMSHTSAFLTHHMSHILL